tara:strand:- start:463 stop:1074 length:612 start_codon:yes stop_codon:yes gene_type:complete
MKKVAIIDYGVGNLLSLKRSLDYLKINSQVTSSKKIIEKSSHLILPGVGAFSSAMKLLKDSKLDNVIKDFASEGKPLLGICLGMQLLFENSYEFGFWDGLGIIPGTVKKINIKKENIPFVGWYKLKVMKNKNNLLEKFDKKYLYHVHSYECVPKNKENIIGNYQVNKNSITCAVKKNNVLGFQFHPEKSSYTGINILEDFCKL